MARLRITKAAEVAGVSRITLFRYIKAGKLSRHPDGTIDTAELLRAGFTLKHATETAEVVEKLRETSTAPQAPDATVTGYLERYITTLEAQLGALRDDLTAARERETLLLHMLQQAQAQAGRLIEAAPLQRPAPAVFPVAGPRRSPEGHPEGWKRILAYLREHGPQRPQDVAFALQMRTARHMIHRMTQQGLLRRLETGAYEVVS